MMTNFFIILIILCVIQAAVNFYYLQKSEHKDHERLIAELANLKQEEKALIAKKEAYEAIRDNFTFEEIENEG